MFAIVVTFTVSYLILAASGPVDRVLGKSGNSILQRVMGLLLAAIAIQFGADGIHDLIPEARPFENRPPGLWRDLAEGLMLTVAYQL